MTRNARILLFEFVPADVSIGFCVNTEAENKLNHVSLSLKSCGAYGKQVGTATKKKARIYGIRIGPAAPATLSNT